MLEKTALDIRDLRDSAGNAGSQIKDWYANLNPEVRNAAIRGLAGSAIGAGLLGSIAAAAPHTDPELSTSIGGPAAMGALLGGAAAAGLPAGLRMLKGNVTLPGEQKNRSVSNTLTGAVLGNPGKTLAGGYGAYSLLGTEPGEQLLQGFAQTKNPATGAQIVRRLQESGLLSDAINTRGIAKAISGVPAEQLANLSELLQNNQLAATAPKLEVLRRALSQLQQKGYVPTSTSLADVGQPAAVTRSREIADILQRVRGGRIVPETSGAVGKVKNLAWRLAETWQRSKPGIGRTPRGLMIGLPAAMAGGVLADKLLSGEV